MTSLIKKLIKINIISILFSILCLSYVQATIFNEIKIIGNDRLSVETIKMFSGLDIGVNIEDEDLNIAIKKLYKTDYFKDIKIFKNNDILEISIIENPIIQSIKIDGIKNKSILKSISEVTKKIEKYPFLESNIRQQQNLLLNSLRSSGFYFAKISTKIIDNKNNSINLIYDVDIGKRAKIKKINFQGNKIFKDSKLRNVIVSEEGSFWKFLTSNKYLDEKKIKNDEILLNQFYKNKGYFNIKIKSSYAKNINNEFFELNFNIDANNKYYFNQIYLNIDDNFSNENFTKVKKDLKKHKGEIFSQKILDNIVEEINKIALEEEYVFINTKYDLTIIEDNKINVDLKFENLEKSFVEQINIFGNFITDEKVIRNSLIIDEGDAFNQILFDKSINDIKSKRIFKTVRSDIKNSNEDKQKKIIDIFVEESPTGEIFAGAGAGTSGASVTAGIKEKNYLGKGIKLTANLMLAEEEIKGKFSVVNPNFRNSDRSLNTIIESTTSDFLSTGGFKTSRTGVGIGTGFEQYNDLYVNLDLSTYYEKLETSSNASAHKKKQEGDYLENLLTYSLIFNKLDQNFQPTDGHKISFKQTLPIYSDDLSISNTINLSKYHSLTDNLILSGKFFLKTVNSIDDDVRVSRRVYIPSSKLRGFESGKIGPKDGNEYVGGNYGSALNLNTTLPNVLSGYENIDLNLFLDAATLIEVDYDSSLESSKIRSSAGVSVNWFTALGPLSFSYAVPISSEPTDKKESFRFRIGTSF
tara:strand:- start:2641 stop:4899 length:2259 start_codon:yes stop_codon:yes gene_type:complete